MPLESNMDVEDRDKVLDALFAQHPDAMIVAIGDNGLFTPMPPGVPLTRQQVINGAPSAMELVVPEDRVTVIETWQRLLNAGVSNALVHPLAAPDQTVRLHFVDVRHRYGVVLGFVTEFSGKLGDVAAIGEVDVTPRVGVMRKDAVAVIREVDDATPRILGWPVGELVGRRALELVHPDDHQRAIESWMDLLGAPGATRRVRLRHQHRDGHYLWLEITNHNLLNNPRHGCVVAEMLDISDEMAAQEALRVNEQLLRRLTEALPVGVLQIDSDLTVSYQNERALEMFGDRLTTTVDMSTLDPAVSEDVPVVAAALTAALTEGADADIEVGFLGRDGEPRRCSANIRPLVSPSGEVSGVVVCATDITDAARLREELRQLATYDALTGCLNRTSVLAAVDEHLATADSGLATVFIDLNEFKEINDTHGHAAGDALLKYVGEALRAAIRSTDLLGRLGGDEFLIVARDVAGPEHARQIGEQLTTHLAACGLDLGGQWVPVRASIGVAWAGPGEMDADALVARADAAMYQAKRQRTGALGLVVNAAA